MRKTGSSREIPPPLELECLRVLWQIGEGTVKDVRTVLNESRPLAYTTVMTLLERLVRKGGVARHKVGRSFVYRPLFEREALRRAAIRELVRSFFEGSIEDLVDYLRRPLEEQPLTSAAVAVGGSEQRLDTALL